MQSYRIMEEGRTGYVPLSHPEVADQSTAGLIAEGGAPPISSAPPMYTEKANMPHQDSHQVNMGAPPGYTVVGSGYTSVGGPYAPPGTYPIAGQQPCGYGMSTDVPQAFIYVQPQPLTNPPKDYMAYSMFATICCCWIVGLFAIMRASECRVAIQAGNRPEAVIKSNQAKKYSHIAVALGIVSIILAAVIFGVYYAMIVSQFH